MAEKEIWKTHPDHAGYKVSNLGRVIGPRGTIRKLHAPSDGYYRLSVHVNGGQSTKLLHRIVCLLFNGPPPTPDHDALHKNHIPGDCRAENLYWGTHQQNMDDREAAGRTYRRYG